MAHVYLETSFVGACVSSRLDAASIFRRQVSRAWWTTQRGKHDLSLAAEVLRELSAPTYPHRDEALALARAARLLPLTEDVVGLAKLLVHEKVMPGPEAAGDAVHVASATVFRADYLLTWNVRHLANPNKLVHLRQICARAGYLTPEILTPDQLWDAEGTNP